MNNTEEMFRKIQLDNQQIKMELANLTKLVEAKNLKIDNQQVQIEKLIAAVSDLSNMIKSQSNTNITELKPIKFSASKRSSPNVTGSAENNNNLEQLSMAAPPNKLLKLMPYQNPNTSKTPITVIDLGTGPKLDGALLSPIEPSITELQKESLSKIKLKNSLKHDNPEKWTCYLCNKNNPIKFSNRWKFNYHMRTKHPKDEDLEMQKEQNSCNYCDYYFTTRHGLRAHHENKRCPKRDYVLNPYDHDVETAHFGYETRVRNNVGNRDSFKNNSEPVSEKSIKLEILGTKNSEPSSSSPDYIGEILQNLIANSNK